MEQALSILLDGVLFPLIRSKWMDISFNGPAS